MLLTFEMVFDVSDEGFTADSITGNGCMAMVKAISLSTFVLIASANGLSLEHRHHQEQNLYVEGRRVHRNPLFANEDSSPYTYSIASIMDMDKKDNFLASQVWPSSRVAAGAINDLSDRNWKVCELGCGPGMPSIVAATMAGRSLVVATDLDEFALELVQAAANDQGLENLITEQVNLTLDPEETIREHESWFHDIDLFVMSDVFESAQVAEGAAALTKSILKNDKNDSLARVWVFAQCDRAQREVYLESMKEVCPDIDWCALENYDEQQRLWLFDLDETKVKYG